MFQQVRFKATSVPPQVTSTASAAAAASAAPSGLKSVDEIPGPPTLPFVGAINYFRKFGTRHDLALQKLKDDFGEIAQFNVFGQKKLTFSNPEDMQKRRERTPLGRSTNSKP